VSYLILETLSDESIRVGNDIAETGHIVMVTLYDEQTHFFRFINRHYKRLDLLTCTTFRLRGLL